MNINQVYKHAVGELAKHMETFPFDKKEVYAEFLAQTYFYTRHSTKLLTLAAARFDFVDYDLHRRFIIHSQEERGHEFMCQKDLTVLGYKMENYPELTTTSAFYQRQYFLIEHVDPICFMGYILALEGMSAMCAGWAKEKLAKLYSEKSVLFLRAHSDEDPDHVDKAMKAIESLAPHRLKLVADNLVSSCALYRAMADEIVANTKNKSQNRVA